VAEAEAALKGKGRAAATVPSREGIVAWALERRAELALAGVVLMAAVIRLYDLGERALHHDESLHATFSWYLYDGRGYTHDPLMHGPFQFFMGALSYILMLGPSDAATRVMPAVFGTAIVAMPWLLRRQIGTRAALIAAVLLCFSPTMLYFSRFDREDIFVAFWTFAIMILIWRYLDERKKVYLYGLGAALAFAFATKELTFMTVAITLVFADCALAYELGKRREGEAVSSNRVLWRTIGLAPVAWAIALGWPLIGGRPFGRKDLPPVGDVLVVVGTLSAPMFAPALQVILPWFGDHLAGLPGIGGGIHDALSDLGNKGYETAAEDGLRTTSTIILLLLSIYLGMLWRPRDWPIIAAAYYIPFILLFTTFFTNTPFIFSDRFWEGHGGLWSGMWGSLDYWIDQQPERRGNQPGYYYLLLTPLYEFLPLLIALAGVAWLALKGNLMRYWLLFWLAGMFIALSLAGEKMPWLETHIALPLILVAAIVLDRALDRLRFDFGERWQRPALFAALAFFGALLVVIGDGGSPMALAGWVLMGAALAHVFFSASEGWRSAGRAALTVGVAALFALTVRAGFIASFENGDTPVELLVYTQTSPELKAVMDRIDAYAEENGLGYEQPILVDDVNGFTWPWAWYLRDYRQTRYIRDVAATEIEGNEILLIGASNASLIDEAAYEAQPYKHRWWFPETYRDLSVSDVFSTLTDWGELKSLGSFFLDRRAPPENSAENAIAFFPTGQPVLPPQPQVQPDGRVVIGAPGLGEGRLRRPAGIWVDAQLNIWVADSGNNRIVKYDPEGNYLLTLDGSATPNGTFTEPWAVAIDWDGTVFVVDTWAHQIHKFSPDLQYVKSWGSPAVNPNPGPYDLFGPRDITFDAAGNLWVSDTGNKRLIQYTDDGEALQVVGTAGTAPGQFDEAVGFRLDAEGNFYIADTWNARIQVWGPDLAPLYDFPVAWESQEVTAKPYLTLLADSSIIITDPGHRVLVRYSKEGEMMGIWQPGQEVYPVGVVAEPNGGFLFSDANSGVVQLIPPELLDTLFQR
jgi:predicted membrane-bound mannosyltransferase/sugar lactone lactonase YvrE